MKQVRLLQGESFYMNFIVSVDGKPQNLYPGEHIAVGFYDEYGRSFVIKSNDTIKKEKQSGYYTAFISHEVTKNFIGDVTVEVMVYNKNNDVVLHADKVLEIYFEEREINNYYDKYA